MNNFNSLLLKIFYEENKDFFIGGRIQKIQQPTRKELLFSIRNYSETQKLYINITPEYSHLCFSSDENLRKRNIKIPKEPPMFCMLLRKYMSSAKITNVRAIEYERIFEIYFENYNEIGELANYCLTIELMGKYSNIILYNSDNKIIIGSMHNVGSDKSRKREIYGGIEYLYPELKKKKDLTLTDFESFYNYLKATSKPYGELLQEKYYHIFEPQISILLTDNNISQENFSAIPKDTFKKIYNKLLKMITCEEYTPCIFNKSISLIKINQGTIYDDINSLIDDYYSEYQNKNLMEKLKRELIFKNDKEIKRITKNIDLNKKLLKKEEKSFKYKKYAELIMANLYYLDEFEDFIEVLDFEGKQEKIQMDKMLTAKENANRYYKLFKKCKNANDYAQKSINEFEEALNYHKTLNVQIEISRTFEDLEEIKSELSPQKIKTKVKEKIRLEPLIYEGFEIYIGKNNKQNDLIYSTISNPEDLWFHVLNQPSGHILVKFSKNKEIPNSVILKACELAKEYSLAKNSSKTSIIYTKRKFLRRPPNTKSGFVTYKNETEVVI